MENRLGNIPWRFLGALFIGLLALGGVVLLMGLVSKRDMEQECTNLQVVVEGQETFIDQADIAMLIRQRHGNVVGRRLREIPLEQMERSLGELPYVSKAEVYCEMDGTVRVSVHQRGIVLRIINQSGSDYYVDTEGKKIPTTLKYVPHVLVANGHISEGLGTPLEEVKSSIVKDLVTVVGEVETSELWRNQVVQLYVNNQGDIVIVPRVGEQDLIIGTADDLTDKLRRLEIFYKKILPKVGSEAYVAVNVKYGDQIICERKDGWFIDSLQMKLNMH